MEKALKAVEVLKSLIISYAFTGLALAIIAFAVFKFSWSENVVNILIICIYIFASFLGGFITGKRVKEKKFFWGVVLGVAYILIIYLVSIILNKEFDFTSTTNITAFVLCIGGGMLGGMLS